MGNDNNKLILGAGVSFLQWKSALQAKLARRSVLGHVFHDIPGIRPLTIPTDPAITKPSSDKLPELTAAYLADLEKWILGEIEAKNVITTRLVSSVCLQNYDNMTAKQIYDTLAGTRQETASAPYSQALENLLSIKYITQLMITLTNF